MKMEKIAKLVIREKKLLLRIYHNSTQLRTEPLKTRDTAVSHLNEHFVPYVGVKR